MMGQGFGRGVAMRDAMVLFILLFIVFVAGGFAFEGVHWLAHHIHVSAWWK